MWIPKYVRDEQKCVFSPLPTQVVSNEEFYPLPQTLEQKQVEARIQELADRFGKMLGLDRRQFLCTSGGMAAAFMALNEVFGPYFEVDAAELLDPAARAEKWPKDQFIFDVQTHHVDVPRGRGKSVLVFRQQAERFNPDLKGHTHKHEDLAMENYIKEIFFDSDTVMGVISGIPEKPDRNILPVERMVETRNKVNGLAGSRRLLSHGLVAPNLKEYNLDRMQWQVEDLKIEAWKMYTGLYFPRDKDGGPWWLDDERLAYPMFEKSRKLGIRNICVHKGLPLFGFNEEHCHPKDVKKAAADFPDLNFIIYHSGFRSLTGGREIRKEKLLTDPHVEWVTELCQIRKADPKLTNVYMELGSTFGHTVILQPLLCGHILGQILDAFGPDHIVWGTDSIWWGSPQWQIEAFRRFQIPPELQQRFGYRPFTKEIKEKILGLNAAKLYGIDVNEQRKALPADYLSRLKMAYLHHGAQPSLAAYGWVPKDV
ncbi:MAG: amidohydrolase [Gemmataceae bacterium]